MKKNNLNVWNILNVNKSESSIKTLVKDEHQNRRKSQKICMLQRICYYRSECVFLWKRKTNNKFDMSIWIFLFIEWHFYSVCLNSHMRLHKIMQSIGAIEIANLKTFEIHQCLIMRYALQKNLQFFYVLFMWSKHNITGTKKNSIAAGGKECVTYEFNWWVCLQW